MCSTLKWKAEFCAAGKKAKQNELYKVFSAYFPAFSQGELRYREPSVNPILEDMKYLTNQRCTLQLFNIAMEHGQIWTMCPFKDDIMTIHLLN
jgi:hypothetical protein